MKRLPADVQTQVESEGEPIRLRAFSMRRLLEIARLRSDAAKRFAFAAIERDYDAEGRKPRFTSS